LAITEKNVMKYNYKYLDEKVLFLLQLQLVIPKYLILKYSIQYPKLKMKVALIGFTIEISDE
jgi:hypothetical protein